MPVAKGVRVRQRDRDALMRIAERDVVDKVAARVNGLLSATDGPAEAVAKLSRGGVLDLADDGLQRLQINVAANLDGLDAYHAATFEEAVAEVADILSSQVPKPDTTEIRALASERTTQAFGKLPERARLRMLNTSIKAMATETGYGAFGLADIQQLIDETVAVNLSQAESLSGDAVSRFVGEASEFRQDDIGIDSYGWLSRRDGDVRETHASNDGFTFMWALAPIETGHPGADYNCRCIAEPDLSESLIESLQAGAEEFITAAALPPEGKTMKHRLRHRNDPTGKRTVRARREGEEPVFRAHVTGLSVRQLEGEAQVAVIGGYGLKWADVYDAGRFTESFRQGAFLDSLDEVRLKIGHDHRALSLARSPGTMDVSEDGEGLAFEARLDLRSQRHFDLYLAIERGDLDGMSIGFWPIDEVVTRTEDGPAHYEVTRAELLEISAVDFPAYESSFVEARDDRELQAAQDRFIMRSRDELSLLSI